MSKAKELQAPIEQLLHALYRRDASVINKLAKAFSKEARRHRVIQAKSDSAPDTDYLLGGWEVLEALTIRANSRQAQNARISVARLRYALDVLQLLARRAAAMSPGALTDELQKQHKEGVYGNNVSRLIARMKAADLVAEHEGGREDARTKPVEITENGRDILEGFRPGWRTYRASHAAVNHQLGEQELKNATAQSFSDEPPLVAEAVTVAPSRGNPRKRLAQQREKAAAATKPMERPARKRKQTARARNPLLAGHHAFEE